jgi:predicted nuclease of predicted toxin-antitoxin system
MKLLLDECAPRRFSSNLSSKEHECLTVPEAGFAGKTNGELLALAEAGFDVFVTLDKVLPISKILRDERLLFFSSRQSQPGWPTCSLMRRPAATQ